MTMVPSEIDAQPVRCSFVRNDHHRKKSDNFPSIVMASGIKPMKTSNPTSAKTQVFMQGRVQKCRYTRHSALEG